MKTDSVLATHTDAPPKALSFGEVERVLAHLFTVASDKRGTFKARLQQLQRLGLPRGTNVGRSERARYEYHQIIDLVIFLDLLDCGVPPNLIRTHFEDTSVLVGQKMLRFVADMRASGSSSVYFLPQLRALSYLQTESSTRTAESSEDHELSFCPANLIASQVSGRPSIVINLSARLDRLRAAIEAEVPGWIAAA